MDEVIVVDDHDVAPGVNLVGRSGNPAPLVELYELVDLGSRSRAI